MNYLDQGFQNLEPDEDRQTDTTERITTPHSGMVKMRLINAQPLSSSDQIWTVDVTTVLG